MTKTAKPKNSLGPTTVSTIALLAGVAWGAGAAETSAQTATALDCLPGSTGPTSGDANPYAGGMCDLGTLTNDKLGYGEASGISADGTVIVGYADSKNDVLQYATHAFRWVGGNMQGLGTLLANNVGTSVARAVSADGSVVAGNSAATDDNEVVTTHAFRWADGTMLGLGTLRADNEGNSFARALSADGTTVVGYASFASGTDHAFRWADGAMQDLGTLGPDDDDESSAYAVSADGIVVVGDTDAVSDTGGRVSHAFRWAEGEMDSLGTLLKNNEGNSRATGLSADGAIIVGSADSVDDNAESTQHAFRWVDGAMLGLGTLRAANAGDSQADAISTDGAVIVGRASSVDDNGEFATHAFRWADGVMQGLGTLREDNEGYSYANAVSADGGVVVGHASATEASAQKATHAFRWVGDTMQDLGTLRVNNTGYSTSVGVSADGAVVVGMADADDGNMRAFIWRGGMQDYTNLMASFPILANETERDVAIQQGSLARLLDKTGFVGVAGRNYVAVNAAEFNMGSDAVTDNHSSQIANLTVGRGISPELTLGGSLLISGASNDASGIEGNAGTGVMVWGEYSQTGLARTGLQASLALGYAKKGNTITRGLGLSDVDAATGAADVKTLAARVSVGYGINLASGWLLTPHAAISSFTTSREAYAEDPTATAFSAAYDKLSVARTLGNVGLVAMQTLSKTSSFSLGAGADFDITVEDTILTGSSNIPGMETFAVANTLVRNDFRPYVTADYSIDIPSGGTVTASARLGKAAYGSEAEAGVGVSYGISF